MCLPPGLTADARIVINRARVECQSHRLTVEDPVTVEYITRYIATLKQVALWIACGPLTPFPTCRGTGCISPCCVVLCVQRYTQSNGRRPFGISALIVGFDYDGTPRLYQTDPSGTYHAWKVSAVLPPFACSLICCSARVLRRFSVSWGGGRQTQLDAVQKPSGSSWRRTTQMKPSPGTTRPSSWPSRPCWR